MSLNRRDFLKISGLAFLTSTEVFGKTIDKTKKDVNDISEEKLETKLNKSEFSIGKIEYNHFITFFDFTDNLSIYKKILEIQSNSGLKIDGIIGAKTLEIIYKKYYSKNLELCSEDIKKRWEVYLDMSQYSKKYSRGIRPDLRHLNVFEHMFYYGKQGLGYDVEGTNLNEYLYDAFDKEIDYKNPYIVIENYKGKTTLRYYNEGILELSTYSTPGSYKHKSYSNKNFYNRGKTDKYHTSRNDKRTGAIMPYAIFVGGRGIWIHGSDHRIDGKPGSGGCFRIPGGKAKTLYDLIDDLPENNLKITIKKIY